MIFAKYVFFLFGTAVAIGAMAAIIVSTVMASLYMPVTFDTVSGLFAFGALFGVWVFVSRTTRGAQ
jgi:hypothetical protein